MRVEDDMENDLDEPSLDELDAVVQELEKITANGDMPAMPLAEESVEQECKRKRTVFPSPPRIPPLPVATEGELDQQLQRAEHDMIAARASKNISDTIDGHRCRTRTSSWGIILRCDTAITPVGSEHGFHLFGLLTY